MQRITKLSKANLMAAETAEIVAVRNLGEDDWSAMIRVTRGEASAYLWGANDFLTWKSKGDARRFVKRFRPDLEPTAFDGK